MKYIISFLMMFFIGLTAMSISAYAYNNTVYFEYPTTPVQTPIDIIDNTLGTNDQYYVIFYYRIPSLSTSQNGYEGYFKVCFDIKTTWTIPQNAQIKWESFSPQTNIKKCDVYHTRTGDWVRSSYTSSFSPMSGSFLGTHDYNIYIIENTIPIVYNGETLEPPPEVQGDSFFVTKDGYTSNFGVYCGPGSEYVTGDNNLPPYYRTKVYTVNIELLYNNTNISYTIPNYLNWMYKYNVYIRKDDAISNTLDYIPKFTFYTEPIYKNSMQALRVPVLNEPGLIAPYEFDDMTDYRSFNQISFGQILSGFSTDYPDLTLNDLYTELHFKFYDNTGNLCYDGVNDFSSLKNSGIEPEEDPYITNLTQSTENLNNYLTSNNKYLQDIMYGDVYTPAPYENTAKDAGSVNLDLISVPEYTYTQHTMNTDATSFFGRMVEWWYLDTPFGVIATVALTLLIIRVILW